uniref:Ubiquinone biosynthesis protein n=1 Tax=Schistocephalus solidus TaxID=70667 RepID=A0A0X3QB85_SCHSO
MFRTQFTISAPLRRILRSALPGRTSRRLSVCAGRSTISFPQRPPMTSFTRTVSTAGNGVISSDSEYSSSSDSNFTVESEDLETLCEKALDAAIQFVPQYGWTREALEAACSAENLPPGLHSLAMPRGGIDLVTHFYECQNHLLAEELARWRAEEPESATSSSRTVAPNSFGFKAPPPFATKAETDAFLRRAIQYRLRSIEKVLPYWPQAMGLLSLPQNVPAAIALEAQLVDEIWAQAGDRSVDMNWYAKRLGLAYVYKLTELFFIQDKSPDHTESWTFLDRRITDLRCMKEAKLKGVANMLREGVLAAGYVTSNILGWNVKK